MSARDVKMLESNLAVRAMGEDERAQTPATDGAQTRASTRHPVYDNAVLNLIGQTNFIGESLNVHCSVLDLSLGGCRLVAKDRFWAKPQLPVEVTFNIRGLPLLLRGTIQWTDGNGMFGIHFVNMSARSQEALDDVLAEITAFEPEE
jgi:hypothetical protein